MSLINIWNSSKDDILSKKIEQIVSIAGDGKLRDGSACSRELRYVLSKMDSKQLEDYANECLDKGKSFSDSGLVLQDIINEVGRRFGFEVTNGVYQGIQNHNNYDGVWCRDNWTFVVEVKTTDTFSIKLQKIAGYLETELKETSKENASCLIVVGRQEDTATLEDQLRGSKHNWEMRIIGVRALFKALELKEMSEDPSLTSRIIDLFKPQEFTRVDGIILAACEFSSDRELASMNEEGTDSKQDNSDYRTVITDREQIEELKKDIARRLSTKYEVNFVRSRSLFENVSKGIRFVITISKCHEQYERYWYGYTPKQMSHLQEVENSFLVFGCLDTGEAYAIPSTEMNKRVPGLRPSYLGEEIRHYHVEIRKDGNRRFIYLPLPKSEFDINQYKI